MLTFKRLRSASNHLIHHVGCTRYFSEIVKFHKFETIVREREIASIPSDDPVMGIVNELKQFVQEFNSNDNMDEFFTRKSQQNVLSVVQCEFEGEYLYFRGRNIEVSLPCGTLCAERSAIGNTTSNNLNLHRKHFKRIAVIDPNFNIIGLEPCGVCKEYLQKFQEESPEFCIITFPDSEFKSIYEYFPAHYPVEDVDSEQTQQLLDKQWTCYACNAVNSGYSINCYLCGFTAKETSKKYSIFQNPALTLRVLDAIHDKFYPNKNFEYSDVCTAMKGLTALEYNVVYGILFHLASSRRGILLRHGKFIKGKFKAHQSLLKAHPSLFVQYRDSLTKNLAGNQ